MHLVLFLMRKNLRLKNPAVRFGEPNRPQAVFFCSPRTTVQRFNFEIGLLSSIHTWSPGLNSLFSSCAC
jgi:hypothetical protein